MYYVLKVLRIPQKCYAAQLLLKLLKNNKCILSTKIAYSKDF